MRKLRTPAALHDWACERIIMDLQTYDPVLRVIDLLANILKHDEWSLMILVALDADGDLAATVEKQFVLLQSTPEFEKKWKIRVDVRVPVKAFERLNQCGEGLLHFLPEGAGLDGRIGPTVTR